MFPDKTTAKYFWNGFNEIETPIFFTSSSPDNFAFVNFGSDICKELIKVFFSTYFSSA